MPTQEQGMIISLMIAVPDAPAAVAWYKQVFDATELWNLGSVVGLEIASSPFFLAEPEKNGWNNPQELGSTTVRVQLFCDNPNAVIARAVAAGANGAFDPIKDHHMPWGIHRQGGFIDPFGHIWLVGDKSPLRVHPEA